jgi:hypothetical protein
LAEDRVHRYRAGGRAVFGITAVSATVRVVANGRAEKAGYR